MCQQRRSLAIAYHTHISLLESERVAKEPSFGFALEQRPIHEQVPAGSIQRVNNREYDPNYKRIMIVASTPTKPPAEESEILSNDADILACIDQMNPHCILRVVVSAQTLTESNSGRYGLQDRRRP